MTKIIVKFLSGAIAAAAIAVFSFGAAQAQSPSDLGGGRLNGSWDVRVTLYNCATGAAIRSFDSVTQFLQGGTLIDSTSAMPQALKTPGQGIWRHTGGDSYIFKFKVFNFDTAGNYSGYQIVSHRAQLDQSGLTYVSAGSALFFNASGALVMSGCSFTTASRMNF